VERPGSFVIRIAAVIVAAGAGRRFGGPKVLARLGGKTFLEHALEAVASCEPRLVVIDPASAPAARARAVSEAAGAVVLGNPDPARGMLSSVKIAIATLDPGVTHALLLPVDHPGIRRVTVDRLLARAADQIVLPVFRKRRGHPVLFPRALFPALLSAPDSEGARAVVHANTVLELPVDDPAVARDVDTPADLRTR
jgi:molybdenum cofactor cytidylyltransferase